GRGSRARTDVVRDPRRGRAAGGTGRRPCRARLSPVRHGPRLRDARDGRDERGNRVRVRGALRAGPPHPGAAVTAWVALVRGVNVGGGNRLPMANFRESIASLGFGDVATY